MPRHQNSKTEKPQHRNSKTKKPRYRVSDPMPLDINARQLDF